MKPAPYLSYMKKKEAPTTSEYTTINFTVQLLTGLWDFVTVATTDKTTDECKALLLATGKYKSASISDVFPGVLGKHLNHTF